MSMTPHQIELMQSTFRNIQPMATTAAEIFYKRLFEIEPATIVLFKGDMKRQGRNFMQVLAVAVGGLSNLSALVPIIQQLGLRHAGCGVRAEHYESVRQALHVDARVDLAGCLHRGGAFSLDDRLCHVRRRNEGGRVRDALVSSRIV
jgi:hemoglobin-like flavoprotein